MRAPHKSRIPFVLDYAQAHRTRGVTLQRSFTSSSARFFFTPSYFFFFFLYAYTIRIVLDATWVLMYVYVCESVIRRTNAVFVENNSILDYIRNVPIDLLGNFRSVLILDTNLYCFRE